MTFNKDEFEKSRQDLLDSMPPDSVDIYRRRRANCKNYHDPSDPVPVALPVGIQRPPSLGEQIARLRYDPNHGARLEALETLLDSESDDDFTEESDELPVASAELNALASDVRSEKKRMGLFKSKEKGVPTPSPTPLPAKDEPSAGGDSGA